MKLKNGLMLNNMGDEYVVIAKSPEIFAGMIKLNKSGAFIFGLLEKGISKVELIQAVTAKYDIDENTAKSDIEEILEVFKNAGITEDE